MSKGWDARMARARVRKVAEGRAINTTYKQGPIDALEAFKADLLAILDEPYATMDAYMAACRALAWRNAQLRAHDIEPLNLQLIDPLAHDPPEGFDFIAAEKRDHD
jgi:hypothetical protein